MAQLRIKSLTLYASRQTQIGTYTKMAKVFLSHSSIDKPFVRRVRRALAPFGTASWLDENEMFPGDPMWKTIVNGIKDSDRALVFVTEDSQKSDWVKKEVRQFLLKEKAEKQTCIIPVLFTPNPPDFLIDRFHVNFYNRPFVSGIKDLLQGILRRKSIFTVTPIPNRPYSLDTFIDEIEQFKKEGIDGNLFIVFDIYDFVEKMIVSLIPDNYQESDRARIAIPKCFDLLSALTPHVIKTILTYYRNDASASPITQRTVQLVWRLVILCLINYLDGKTDQAILGNLTSFIFQDGLDEINRLESIKSQFIPSNVHVGVLSLAWLEYLKRHWDETHDIGFSGAKTKEGIQILDAGHVRIPKGQVREDSLKRFRDTPPDAEFFPVTWVKSILPYIVANAVLQYGFAGVDVAEVAPRIGLKKSDYYRFGIE